MNAWYDLENDIIYVSITRNVFHHYYMPVWEHAVYVMGLTLFCILAFVYPSDKIVLERHVLKMLCLILHYKLGYMPWYGQILNANYFGHSVWDNDQRTRHSWNQYQQGLRPRRFRLTDDEFRGHYAIYTPINYESPIIVRCFALTWR